MQISNIGALDGFRFRITESNPKTIMPGHISLLDYLMKCLSECMVEDLDKPIDTQSHGESAARFFWIMIMHDISHVARSGRIRRAYGA